VETDARLEANRQRSRRSASTQPAVPESPDRSRVGRHPTGVTPWCVTDHQ
jgi:hypothetical protein